MPILCCAHQCCFSLILLLCGGYFYLLFFILLFLLFSVILQSEIGKSYTEQEYRSPITGQESRSPITGNSLRLVVGGRPELEAQSSFCATEASFTVSFTFSFCFSWDSYCYSIVEQLNAVHCYYVLCTSTLQHYTGFAGASILYLPLFLSATRAYSGCIIYHSNSSASLDADSLNSNTLELTTLDLCTFALTSTVVYSSFQTKTHFSCFIEEIFNSRIFISLEKSVI